MLYLYFLWTIELLHLPISDSSKLRVEQSWNSFGCVLAESCL
jgi:hypothetical protein